MEKREFVFQDELRKIKLAVLLSKMKNLGLDFLPFTEF